MDFILKPQYSFLFWMEPLKIQPDLEDFMVSWLIPWKSGLMKSGLI